MLNILFLNNLKKRLKSSDVLYRMSKGAFWSIFGTASAKLFVLISGILCAHILGKDNYGELGLIRSTINMFVVFGSVGLGVTATKYVSEYIKKNKEIVSKTCSVTTIFAFFTASIVCSIIYFIAPIIVDGIDTGANVTYEIRLGTLILFATILNGAINGILVGLEDFKNIARNTFISSIIESVLILVGSYYYGVIGAILGYGLGIFALFVANFFTVLSLFNKLDIPLFFSNLNKTDFKVLYKFSLPAAVSSFLVTPVFWVTRTMLIKYNGLGELGIYEAADQWKVIILFLPAALSQIVLPILSSKFGENNRSDFSKALKYNLILNGSITFTFATVISILSPWLIKLYGDGFSNYTPIIWLSISTIFSSLASVVGMAIISRGKVWIGLCFNILWAIMFTSFTYVSLIYGFGVNGLAFSLSLSYALHTGIQLIYLHRVLKYSI